MPYVILRFGVKMPESSSLKITFRPAQNILGHVEGQGTYYYSRAVYNQEWVIMARVWYITYARHLNDFLAS